MAINDLFKEWADEECTSCVPLAANGSNRQYYRVCGTSRHCIGAVNPDIRENRAFCYFSRLFHQAGLPVPELYAVSGSVDCYLQQDLGDMTLYQMLQSKKESGTPFDDEVVEQYRMVLADLVRFQDMGRQADYSYAYPRADFDKQSIQWDLNYFKYYYLKTSSVAFDEQMLEDDFQRLITYLLEVDCGYFLYRDFQPRNIMLADGRRYYIDYQGGRRGAAQYDVASLLYSAKSEMPAALREELLEYYISLRPTIDADEFREHYYAYVLVRLLQAMGAYGFRGRIEGKAYFLESIPLAKRNLAQLLQEHPLNIVPYLNQILAQLAIL